MTGDTTNYGSRGGYTTSEHIYGFTVGPANVQTVTFDACNSEFDVVLHMFREGLDDSIARIDQDACGSTGRQELVTIDLEPAM